MNTDPLLMAAVLLMLTEGVAWARFQWKQTSWGVP